jgi:flagellar basal-body rod modification protein FlgD
MTSVTSTSSNSSPTATMPSNPRGVLGKNEFLKLLVAQMKHQDPLNPAQGDQMAAQLAQFSSLEQLQNINSTLETQTSNGAGIIESIQTSAAMGTVGKTVVANGDGVEIPGGGDPGNVAIRATIPAGGGKATLKIMNESGSVIATRDLGNVSAGVLDTTLGEAGEGLVAGSYRFAVDVIDSEGAVRSAATSMVGVVTAVQATSTGPVLRLRNLYVPFNSVTEIRS